jgi:antitoxin (DNA-binding transcriptional repressor) of toxin-antitoxin stability system
MYIGHMSELTATNLRKHLFEVLDQAIRGETVEITYKGSKLRLAPTQNTSKLARAVRRSTLLVNPDSIVHSDNGLMAELEQGWRKDDETL